MPTMIDVAGLGLVCRVVGLGSLTLRIHMPQRNRNTAGSVRASPELAKRKRHKRQGRKGKSGMRVVCTLHSAIDPQQF